VTALAHVTALMAQVTAHAAAFVLAAGFLSMALCGVWILLSAVALTLSTLFGA
jgi:hypothetical protein